MKFYEAMKSSAENVIFFFQISFVQLMDVFNLCSLWTYVNDLMSYVWFVQNMHLQTLHQVRKPLLVESTSMARFKSFKDLKGFLCCKECKTAVQDLWTCDLLIY